MQRANLDAPWGTPQNLGPNINTNATEQCPHLTPDGHTLMFASTRAGGVGGSDLYVSRRSNQRDDFGWDIAENLGSGINSPSTEVTPAVFEDPNNGNIVLYFGSNRPGGAGGADIYSSVMETNGIFGPSIPVPELNSGSSENFPVARNDGLELYFASDRPGTLGNTDMWITKRATTSAPWSAPVNLGPNLNSPSNDVGAALALNQTSLIFDSDRPGGQGSRDLYLLTRRRVAVQAPAINAGGVVNAITYATGSVAPSSLVSIFGVNLATVTAAGQRAGDSYPTRLFGTRVTFGSMDAQLLYVSPLQINAVVPSGLGSGTTNVTVIVDGAASAPRSVSIQ